MDFRIFRIFEEASLVLDIEWMVSLQEQKILKYKRAMSSKAYMSLGGPRKDNLRGILRGKKN